MQRALDLTTSQHVRQAMARHGITPVKRAGTMLHILVITMFFSTYIASVVQELEKTGYTPEIPVAANGVRRRIQPIAPFKARDTQCSDDEHKRT